MIPRARRAGSGGSGAHSCPWPKEAGQWFVVSAHPWRGETALWVWHLGTHMGQGRPGQHWLDSMAPRAFPASPVLGFPGSKQLPALALSMGYSGPTAVPLRDTGTLFSRDNFHPALSRLGLAQGCGCWGGAALPFPLQGNVSTSEPTSEPLLGLWCL